MSAGRYTFAKVFVDVHSAEDAFGAISSSAGFRVVESGPALLIAADDVAEVEFLTSTDTDRSAAEPDAPDFLFYPTLVEVVPHDEADDPRVVATVESVLAALRGRGWSAVVAADFEDELAEPGYRDES